MFMKDRIHVGLDICSVYRPHILIQCQLKLFVFSGKIMLPISKFVRLGLLPMIVSVVRFSGSNFKASCGVVN